MKKQLLLAALTAFTMTVAVHAEVVNMVFNGNFEDPNYKQAVPDEYTWNPVNTWESLSALPGWSVDKTGGVWNGVLSLITGTDNAGDGDIRPEEDLNTLLFKGYLQNGWTSINASQIVKNLVPGREYTLDFLMAQNQGEGSVWTPEPDYGFTISEVDGVNAGKEILTVKNMCQSQDLEYFAYRFTAPADGQIFLNFFLGNYYFEDNYKDDLWMKLDLVRIYSFEGDEETGSEDSGITPGKVVATVDFSKLNSYPYNPGDGVSAEITNDVLKVSGSGWWQFAITQDLILKPFTEYTITFGLKGSESGSASTAIGNWNGDDWITSESSVTIPTEWTKCSTTFTSGSADYPQWIMLQPGSYSGVLSIAWAVVSEGRAVPNETPALPENTEPSVPSEGVGISIISNGNANKGQSENCIARIEGIDEPAPVVDNPAGSGKVFSCPVVAHPENSDEVYDWTSQLFIKFNEPLKEGTTIKVSFDYYCTDYRTIYTQAHGEPGYYHHWAFIGSLDAKPVWQKHEATVTLTNAQAGDEGCQSIAFSLSTAPNSAIFYINNITVEKMENSDFPDDNNPSITPGMIVTTVDFSNLNSYPYDKSDDVSAEISNNVLKVSGSGWWQFTLVDDLNLHPETEYTLTVGMKGSDDLSANVVVGNWAGDDWTDANQNISLSKEWKRCSTTFRTNTVNNPLEIKLQPGVYSGVLDIAWVVVSEGNAEPQATPPLPNNEEPDTPSTSTMWVPILSNLNGNSGQSEYCLSRIDGIDEVAPVVNNPDGSGMVFYCPIDADPIERWSSQMFIKFPEPVWEGTTIRVSFDYYCTDYRSIDTEAHGEPASYHHWYMLGSLSAMPEWQRYEGELTITYEQAMDDGCGSIAFDLSTAPGEAIFYLNNITVEKEEVVDVDNDFEDRGIKYSIIDPANFTCKTKEGYNVNTPGNVFAGNLEIPDVVTNGKNNYTVVEIGRYGFTGNDIKSLSVPETVTSIGAYAFYDCRELKSVTLPQTASSIGEQAFALCAKITAIKLPEALSSIGQGSFSATGLTEVTIPESVTAIGNSAFERCANLTTVVIPESVISLGSWTFSHCTNISAVTYNAAKPAWGDSNLFSEEAYQMAVLHMPNAKLDDIKNQSPWSNFQHVIAKDGSANIALEAGTDFSYRGITYTVIDAENFTCRTRTGTGFETPGNVTEGEVVIPSTALFGPTEFTVVEIGAYGFTGLGISSVSLPETLVSIGKYAFYECEDLASAIIPEKVTSIGEGAFSACENLETLSLPASLASIGGYAFYGCENLTEVTYSATAPLPAAGTTFDSATYDNAVLNMPEAALEDILAVTPWNRFANINAMDGSTGVEDLVSDGMEPAVKVTVENGSITLFSATDRDIEILDINGRVIRAVSLSAGEAQKVTGLAKGLYLVANRKVII